MDEEGTRFRDWLAGGGGGRQASGQAASHTPATDGLPASQPLVFPSAVLILGLQAIVTAWCLQI